MTPRDDDTQEIPAAVQRKVIDSFFERWTKVVTFALVVGGVVVAAGAWATDVTRTQENHEQRLKAIEPVVAEARGTFRLVCVMADRLYGPAADTLKALVDVNCPAVYAPRGPR